MHLTNYAINKDSPNYIFNDSVDDLSKGHKKSLAEFFDTMACLGLPAEKYWSEIKDIAVKTMIAGVPWLKKESEVVRKASGSRCFEVLGLDFMIEEDHRVLLIEVNHTPSFFTDTPLDHLLKSSLIRDVFEIVTREDQKKRRSIHRRLNTVGLEEREDLKSGMTFSRAK